MFSGLTLTWGTVAVIATLLGVYILYLFAMAGFLAICGVPRSEIAKWALKQAGRQRLVDLVSVALGKSAPSSDRSSG